MCSVDLTFRTLLRLMAPQKFKYLIAEAISCFASAKQDTSRFTYSGRLVAYYADKTQAFFVTFHVCRSQNFPTYCFDMICSSPGKSNGKELIFMRG